MRQHLGDFKAHLALKLVASGCRGVKLLSFTDAGELSDAGRPDPHSIVAQPAGIQRQARSLRSASS